MVQNLITGNELLRLERDDALQSDKAAGMKAVRAFRTIQLALRGKTPEEILDWLDDQIFDMIKFFDRLQHKLGGLRTRLLDCEKIVMELENSPMGKEMNRTVY
jgi:hypothetical protein